jgi:hypothetical protein
MFGLIESKERKINIAELVYIIATLAVCIFIGLFNVNIDIIIDLNGAVLGFCFVYFLPSLLHLKCMYFSKGKRKMPSTFSEGEVLMLEAEKKEEQKDREIELEQVEYE